MLSRHKKKPVTNSGTVLKMAHTLRKPQRQKLVSGTQSWTLLGVSRIQSRCSVCNCQHCQHILAGGKRSAHMVFLFMLLVCYGHDSALL
jgi:hypothetical protein